MKTKKIFSIVLAFVLLMSAVMPSTLLSSRASAEAPFVAQHAFVDFTKYAVESTDKNHLQPGYITCYPWSVTDEGQTGNKYLKYAFTSSDTASGIGSGKQHQCSFLVNSVGRISDKDSSYYLELKQDGIYRVRFKYKLSCNLTTTSISLDAFKFYYNTSGPENFKPQTIISATSGIANSKQGTKPIPRTDDWKEYEVLFKADNLDSSGKNYLRFRFNVPTTATDFDFCIDDLQVDRLKTVTYGATDYYYAPPCQYSQYLFSETVENKQDYAGEAIPQPLSDYTKIDFSEYVISTGNNSGIDGTQWWSSEEDADQGKYLKFTKTAVTSVNPNTKIYSFLTNPTGDYQTPSKTIQVSNSKTYKYSFKYKLSSAYRVEVMFDAMNTYVNSNTSTNFINLSKAQITEANDWKEFSGTFIANTSSFSSEESKSLRFRISINYGSVPVDSEIEFSIDDLVIERVYWQGDASADSNFAGGDGTEKNPYKIANANQLAYLAKTVSEVTDSSNNPTSGKYYVLTADIDLNNTNRTDWKENDPNKWYYSTDEKQAFMGVLNGQGYKINGLYVNADPSVTSYGGLFGILGDGAIIKNITFNNAYVTATYAGVVSGAVKAGNNKTSEIRRIWLNNNQVVSNGTDIYAGGFIGEARSDTLISEFYTCADTSASFTKVGSLVGTAAAKTNIESGISNSGRPLIGVINNPSDITVKSVYTTAVNDINGVTNLADETEIYGENAKIKMPDLDWDYIWATGSSTALPHFRAYSSETDAADYVDPNALWDGRKATEYGGGDGTKDNPYLIKTPAQLALLVGGEAYSSYYNHYKTEGKYYKLENDIVINDISKPDWQENATQWYSVDSTINNGTQKAFCGTLDGNGHKILGLYINNKVSGSYGGLFISIGKNAVIKNLGIDNSYICAENAGAFFANVERETTTDAPIIAGCYVGNKVVVEASCENGNVGGFIGTARYGVVFKYCYSKCNAIATDATRAGSFVGYGSGKDIVIYKSCYSAPVNTKLNIQGITKTRMSRAYNVYATSNTISMPNVTTATVSQMKGSKAKDVMTRFDFDKVWITNDNDTPRLRVFEQSGYNVDLVEYVDIYNKSVKDDARAGDIWSGNVSSGLRGNGTETEPYEIWTGEDLAYFLEQILNSSWASYSDQNGFAIYASYYKTYNKYYKIMADIYLNDVSEDDWYTKENLNEWYIGGGGTQALQGTLDGNGHIIYGLYVNSESDTYVGLIPGLGPFGVIKNLGIASSYIKNGNYVGAFVGSIENKETRDLEQIGLIDGCFSANDVTLISNRGAGGLVGFAPAPVHIRDCYSISTVSGEARRIGGLIAYSPINVGQKFYRNTDKQADIIIENSFCSNANRDYIIGPLSYDTTVAKNSYANRSDGREVTVISFSNMTDEKAKENMTSLDFNNVWTTVEKATPALKIFAERNDFMQIRYNITRFKGPVTINFETYGGEELAPLIGESGTKLKLPTPVRDTDKFDGWYVYALETWDVPFTYDYFPDDDITLYAKWITYNIRQTFERYTYTSDENNGLEEGYKLYKPGLRDYDTKYVHGGSRSLYRSGDTEGYANAALCTKYTMTLTPGAQYEISMWVYLVGKSSSDDKLMISYLQEMDWPVDEDATETIADLSSLQTGKWVNVTYKFVAYGKYIGLRTPSVEMYIDDVNIIYTGKSGLKSMAVVTPLKTITEIVEEDYEWKDEPFEDNSLEDESFENSENNGNGTTKRIIKKILKKKSGSNDVWIYITIGASALVVVGGAVIFLLIKKKKLFVKKK